jgi:hypothetical protein
MVHRAIKMIKLKIYRLIMNKLNQNLLNIVVIIHLFLLIKEVSNNFNLILIGLIMSKCIERMKDYYIFKYIIKQLFKSFWQHKKLL